MIGTLRVLANHAIVIDRKLGINIPATFLFAVPDAFRFFNRTARSFAKFFTLLYFSIRFAISMIAPDATVAT